MNRFGIVYGALLLALISAAGAVQAQAPVRLVNAFPLRTPGPPPFCRTFTRADLPPGTIRAVCQTRDGFLWLLVQHLGLVRFDGQAYRTFGAGVLGSTELRQLVEGQDSELYMASDRGLCRFDLRTHQANLFAEPGPLLSVHETRAGVLLVSGPAGVFQFNKKTHRFRDLRHDPVVDARTGRPRRDSVTTQPWDFHSVPDPRGWVWAYFSGTDRPVYAYDPPRRRWLAYPTPAYRGQSSLLVHHGYTSLCPDEDGRYVWLGGWVTGLQRLDRRTGEWVCYDLGGGRNNCLSIAPGAGRQLWLTFDGIGLGHFTRQTGQLSFFPPQPARLGGVPTGLLGGRQGQGGAHWLVGTQGTLTAFLPTQQRMPYQKLLPAGEHVTRLEHDDATDRTLFATSDRQGTRSLYLREPDDRIRHRRYPNWFHFLKRDGAGILWVGVQKPTYPYPCGFYRLHPRTLRLQRVTRRIGEGLLTTDSVRVCQAQTDGVGNLWFATVKHGVVCLPPGTGPGQHWPVREGRTGSSYVRWILPDDEGRVWLGREFSLQRLTPATGRLEEFLRDSLPGENIPLCFDTEGTLWVSKKMGLWRLRKGERRFESILPRLYVTQGVADAEGTLWLTASDALHRFEPKTGSLQRLDGQNGLSLEPFETEFTDKRLLLTQRGDLMLSDQYRFPTRRSRADSVVPASLAFTGFRVFDRELSLPQAIDATHRVALTYQQNFFTVEYALLDFLPPRQHRYQYRLEGLEDTWQSGEDRRAVSYTNLSPGTYQFRVRAAGAGGHWGTERTLGIDIQPPFWLTTWFRALAAALLLGVVYFLYRYRLAQVVRRSEVRRREAELREQAARLQQRLAETEMAALRSQMNPHFIFNCLNSIKLYTLEADSATASQFLTKFSRLIRLVLENSRAERVTLGTELEALRLYVELEAMRFKSKLRYEIRLAAGVDLQYTEIPPLLIQPYVENAIWHGLMHKAEGGTVTVDVSQPDENLLRVEITDDGVGRQRAAELKSKSAGKHKSFGMQVTADRIRMINQLYSVQTQARIYDLADSFGEACGTSVILEIPV